MILVFCQETAKSQNHVISLVLALTDEIFFIKSFFHLVHISSLFCPFDNNFSSRNLHSSSGLSNFYKLHRHIIT